MRKTEQAISYFTESVICVDVFYPLMSHVLIRGICFMSDWNILQFNYDYRVPDDFDDFAFECGCGCFIATEFCMEAML